MILTFPDELDLGPVEVTILDNGKIGIDVSDEVEILRSELVTDSILSACD